MTVGHDRLIDFLIILCDLNLPAYDDVITNAEVEEWLFKYDRDIKL